MKTKCVLVEALIFFRNVTLHYLNGVHKEKTCSEGHIRYPTVCFKSRFAG